ncbi:hypothetical protein GCM10022405_14880 [Gibbsiella dentisursi]|uniref:Uncharacterized protein n=1 Tax=Gibbsiella dentisursi TaxID=796890 RepID=A0ABP7L0T1_9GAMM
MCQKKYPAMAGRIIITVKPGRTEIYSHRAGYAPAKVLPAADKNILQKGVDFTSLNQLTSTPVTG